MQFSNAVPCPTPYDRAASCCVTGYSRNGEKDPTDQLIPSNAPQIPPIRKVDIASLNVLFGSIDFSLQ